MIDKQQRERVMNIPVKMNLGIEVLVDGASHQVPVTVLNDPVSKMFNEIFDQLQTMHELREIYE